MAHAGELPEGWSTQVSRSTGDVFYVNLVSNESTYDMPTVSGAEWAAPAAEHGAEADEAEADVEQHAAELPEGWATQVSSRDGAVYYVNTLTNESTFDLPTVSAAEMLPLGWDAEHDESSGDVYFVNSVTGDTTYEIPTEPAAGEAAPDAAAAVAVSVADGEALEAAELAVDDDEPPQLAAAEEPAEAAPQKQPPARKPKKEAGGGAFACCGGKPKPKPMTLYPPAPAPAPEPEPEPTVVPEPEPEPAAEALDTTAAAVADLEAEPLQADAADPAPEEAGTAATAGSSEGGDLPEGWSTQVSRSTGDVYYVRTQPISAPNLISWDLFWSDWSRLQVNVATAEST